MSPLVARVSFVLFDLPVVYSECECTLFCIFFFMCGSEPLSASLRCI